MQGLLETYKYSPDKKLHLQQQQYNDLQNDNQNDRSDQQLQNLQISEQNSDKKKQQSPQNLRENSSFFKNVIDKNASSSPTYVITNQQKQNQEIDPKTIKNLKLKKEIQKQVERCLQNTSQVREQRLKPKNNNNNMNNVNENNFVTQLVIPQFNNTYSYLNRKQKQLSNIQEKNINNIFDTHLKLNNQEIWNIQQRKNNFNETIDNPQQILSKKIFNKQPGNLTSYNILSQNQHNSYSKKRNHNMSQQYKKAQKQNECEQNSNFAKFYNEQTQQDVLQLNSLEGNGVQFNYKTSRSTTQRYSNNSRFQSPKITRKQKKNQQAVPQVFDQNQSVQYYMEKLNQFRTQTNLNKTQIQSDKSKFKIENL